MVTFDEPRPMGFSLHHEILPEGHKRSDLINRDFCFYDMIEPYHTPSTAKMQQQMLDEMIGNRLGTYRKLNTHRTTKRQPTNVSNLVDPDASLM